MISSLIGRINLPCPTLIRVNMLIHPSLKIAFSDQSEDKHNTNRVTSFSACSPALLLAWTERPARWNYTCCIPPGRATHWLKTTTGLFWTVHRGNIVTTLLSGWWEVRLIISSENTLANSQTGEHTGPIWDWRTKWPNIRLENTLAKNQTEEHTGPISDWRLHWPNIRLENTLAQSQTGEHTGPI